MKPFDFKDSIAYLSQLQAPVSAGIRGGLLCYRHHRARHLLTNAGHLQQWQTWGFDQIIGKQTAQRSPAQKSRASDKAWPKPNGSNWVKKLK